MFGDAILKMMGNEDPRIAMLQAMQGGSGTPPGGAGTPDAAGGAPGTAGAQQPPQPVAYTSPPEIASLYADLLEHQRRSTMIDRGIGLIGASLAQPQNRASILNMFGGGGGGGGSGSSDPMKMATDMMQFQQQQMQLQQRAAHRAALPSIAAQYGLDLQTAQYLFDSGNLDSLLSELSKPDNQIVQQSDGTYLVVDKRSGSMSDPFGVPKPRDIEIVTDDRGNQFPVYKDTGTRVGAENLVDGQGATSDERLWRADEADRSARGMPSRSLSDFIREADRNRAGAANLGPSGIDYGDAPKDMVWARDDAGNVLLNEEGQPIARDIVNSPKYLEQRDAAAKSNQMADQRHTTASVVGDEVDYALRLINENKDGWFPVTGLQGVVIGSIPMQTPHYDFQQALETIKANIGFEKLQAMREASPTGGALGQVSDFENRLLQATMGSLEVGQRRETLVRRLERVKSLFGRVDKVLNASSMEEAEREANTLSRELYDVEKSLRRTIDTEVGNDAPIEDIMKRYGG